MRVVVNAIAAESGGALTILRSFHSYVRNNLAPEDEWIFLLGSPHFGSDGRVRSLFVNRAKLSRSARLLFDFFSGRRLLAALRPDVVFSLQNTLLRGAPCPQVLYVHQALPFQRYRRFSLLRRRERNVAISQHLIGLLIKRSVRLADHVVVQTKWMRDAIVAQTGISATEISVLQPDLERVERSRSRPERDPQLFFYPTADLPYKNLECIYQAVTRLSSFTPGNFRVLLTIDGPAGLPGITHVGRISREDVLRIMQNSTLVYPSYVESYGLPLAEGRSLGALILAADCSYAREVLAGYPDAHFFDPFCPDNLADLMHSVLAGVIKPRGQPESATEDSSQRVSTWKAVVDILREVETRRAPPVHRPGDPRHRFRLGAPADRMHPEPRRRR